MTFESSVRCLRFLLMTTTSSSSGVEDLVRKGSILDRYPHLTHPRAREMRIEALVGCLSSQWERHVRNVQMFGCQNAVEFKTRNGGSSIRNRSAATA